MKLLNMLHTVLIPFSQSMSMSNILAIFGGLFLALCSVFYIYQWKIIKKYRSFPSQRLEAKAVFMYITEYCQKTSSITKVIFQIILNAVKSFSENGICVLWFLKPYVVVYSAELMKDLVNSVDLADKSGLYDVNKEAFGNGLIGSKHEIWKVHRKMIDPAFSLSILKSRMRNMNSVALQLAEKLGTVEDKPADAVWNDLKYCAFLNMGDFAFGMKLDDDGHMALIENSMKIVNTMEELFVYRLAHPWLYPSSLLPLFPAGRKYLKCIADGDSLIREGLNEVTTTTQNVDGQDRNSCSKILLKLHQQDPSFTEQDVRDHVVNLATAGYDTVAITMVWCFYTLSHHPEVQEKAYCEVQSVVPDGDVTYDDLGKLKYLDCIIKETLRLFPTIPMVGRKARNDIQCGQYTIPKGAEVSFFIYMLHRDPKVFQEPNKFDPERFLDSSAIKPWMHIPFAEGYRNCIGKRFAMMEMKVMLVHILRRFRITCQEKIDENDLDWKVTLRPGKFMQFFFEKRNSTDSS